MAFFTNTDQSQPSPVSSPKPAATIGRQTVIQGTVSGSGEVVVYGSVEGRISLSDNLVVEREANIQADIESKSATLMGRVDGRLSIAEHLILKTGSILTGDIKSKQLVVEDGARFTGQIAMDFVLPDTI